jgi:NAD(P)-dependent dehydrogenase (short-subunit alcohol dehydrogenase family)
MNGRHVAITGAAGGIGQALAHAFTVRDWLVTGIDRLPVPGAATIVHELADVTDEPALAAVFDRAWARHPVDAVIANAALTDLNHQMATELDYAVWQRVLRVNVDGSFLTARLAAQRMLRQRHGNIVFVTSSLAFFDQAKAWDAPYCASKSAVEMLMRVMSRELSEKGVNVNSLFPSVMIDTGFFAHLTAEQRTTLARPSLLDETALFLASLQPGALTGVSLDQQRWDTDSAYRRSLREGIDV